MRRHTRWLLAAAAAIVALPLLLAASLYGIANSVTGRGWIERSTASLTHGGVELTGLGGHFPGDLTLQRLRLRDAQGLWLTVEDIELRCEPWRLLAGHLRVIELAVGRVRMERVPIYPHHPHPPARFNPWPRLGVERLAIERFELPPPLAGSEVAVEVQGAGSWSPPVRFSAQLRARRLDAVPSVYRLEAQFDARQWRGQLELAEDADGPLAHLIGLPQLGSLSLHLTLLGPPQAVAVRLELLAGALSGQANGTLDARAGAAAVEVALDSGAMAPRAGLGWTSLHLSGHARGALRAPELEAQLEAAGLGIGPLSMPRLHADLSGHAGTLELAARGEGLRLPGRFGALLADTALELHAQLHPDRPGRPLEFTLSHALLAADGRWSGGAAGSGELDAELRRLQPLAAAAGIDLRGTAHVTARVAHAAGSWQLQGSGLLDVGGGAEPLAALLSPRVKLAATMNLDERELDLANAQLDSPRLEDSARGRYRQGESDFEWRAGLRDLAALSARLSGSASAEGRLAGRAGELTLVARLRAGAQLEGPHRAELQATLRAAGLTQHPSAQLTGTGTLEGSPIGLAATAAVEAGGALQVQLTRLAWRSASVQGRMQWTAGVASQGSAALSIGQLADFDDLGGRPLTGTLTAQLAFDGAVSGGRLRGQIDASHAGLAAQPFEVLALSGSLEGLRDHPVLSAELSGRAAVHAVPTRFEARLHGPEEAVAIDLAARSEGDADTRSQLAAAGTLDAAQRELRLRSMRFDYQGETLRLLAPARLAFGEVMRVQGLRLGLGSSIWEAQGQLRPALDLQASVRELSPDLLRPWWPWLQADGRVGARAELHGSWQAPEGSVHLEGSGLHARGGSARALPPGDLTIDAQLARTVAQVQASAHAGPRLQLRASGQAPLNASAPMALTVSGALDLLLVSPILEASGQRLRGAAKLDAELGGTPAAPQARGSLSVTQGSLDDDPHGLHLTSIEASVTAAGPRLRLERLLAHAGPGTLSASGSLGLERGLPLELELQAHEARLLASDLITASVDSDLRVSGRLRQRIDASGKLHVIRADVNIPNALPPDVAVLKVQRAGAAPPPPEVKLQVGLDLRVDAPRAVFVKGRGVDAEVAGALHARGTLEEPVVSGGFDLRSGSISLAGSTLYFTSGRVSFNGSGVHRRLDPTLDFTASKMSGGATYRLNVGGYADAPVITLSSTPEQPQDQILARLLFGADPAQLSTLQIAQIAATLASMSGLGGGFNPLNTVQRALGLDRLAISGSSNGTAAAGPATPAANNAATIEAGRYVTDRVYVGAKQFTTGTTQAQVQVDLTRSLKVQAAVGTGGGTIQGETPQNDPGSSIGLSYQFEY